MFAGVSYVPCVHFAVCTTLLYTLLQKLIEHH